MPAPAVYILAIVGTIAAGIAFKEFVYEPHIAPKIEQWAEEFVAKRQARRRHRAGAIPVAVSGYDLTDENVSRRRSKRSDSGDEENEESQSIELEHLIAKEVREWRSEVDRSQVHKLRHRNNAVSSSSRHVLDESTHEIPFIPMSPMHIIYDPTEPSTPTSTLPSRGSSISARVSSLREAPSELTLRSPLPVHPELQAPALHSSISIASTNSTPPSPTPVIHSPRSVPSLSQSYPQELDYEHGLELLSAPSSRPDTPFSSFSQAFSSNGTPQLNSLYYSLSPPRAPSRSLSDLDYLSDLEEPQQHDGMSPRTSVFSIDDGVRSELSDSSWAGASDHRSQH